MPEKIQYFPSDSYITTEEANKKLYIKILKIEMNGLKGRRGTLNREGGAYLWVQAEIVGWKGKSHARSWSHSSKSDLLVAICSGLWRNLDLKPHIFTVLAKSNILTGEERTASHLPKGTLDQFHSVCSIHS